MNRLIWRSLSLIVLFVQSACASSGTPWPKIESLVKKDPVVEKRVQDILAKMTLAEKVGQMVQAEIQSATPEDVKKYNLGSILNGGGSFPGKNKYAKISDWVKLSERYYQASIDKGPDNSRIGVPVIWGTDAVHGHNNVYGATIFPHNIGLGAARNPELVKKIGQATARTVLATGIDWIFAPTVAVVRNDRWGRTYESYSENPEVVKSYAEKVVLGLQGDLNELFDQNHVVSTVKHFVGDGGTKDGIDQGDNQSSEEELFSIHAAGYLSGLAAGAQTVMASFNSWKGEKIHGHHYLLTTVLKQKMGFDGFVIGDWNGHGQVQGCSNTACAQAINAGVDMIMVPNDWKAFLANTIKQVEAGEIKLERINDAVTRILRVKMRYGLFDKGSPVSRPLAGQTQIVGSKENRDLARQAVRESLVLLKNKSGILPLAPSQHIVVAGSGAHNIGQQSGGWTLSWQGTGNRNEDFPGAQSIYDGISEVVSKAGGKAELWEKARYALGNKKKPDVAIVVFGEQPYAEGQGDIFDLYYGLKNPKDLGLLKSFKQQGIPVVSVFLTGRPLWVNPEINASDAFVVAWLPGSEGRGVAEVLFKDSSGKIVHDFKGRLPFNWPKTAIQFESNLGDSDYAPLFSYGAGLSYKDTDTLGDDLSEIPFPPGNGGGTKDEVIVFKGRNIPPFINYAGDFANWHFPLAGAVGQSRGGLVSVKAIDKDVQEDARQVTFHGGDSNYYFQANQTVDISHLVTKEGQLQFDIRIDKRPNHEANLLLGKAKINFNSFLNHQKMGNWFKVSVKLECFKRKGADLKSLDMPFSLATFGAMEVSLANIEIRSKSADVQTLEIACH